MYCPKKSINLLKVIYFVFIMEDVVYSVLYYFTGIYLNPRLPWKYVFRISILEDSPTRWTISNICSSNWISLSLLKLNHLLQLARWKSKTCLNTTTFSFTFVNVCCSCDISMKFAPKLISPFVPAARHRVNLDAFGLPWLLEMVLYGAPPSHEGNYLTLFI